MFEFSKVSLSGYLLRVIWISTPLCVSSVATPSWFTITDFSRSINSFGDRDKCNVFNSLAYLQYWQADTNIIQPKQILRKAQDGQYIVFIALNRFDNRLSFGLLIYI